MEKYSELNIPPSDETERERLLDRHFGDTASLSELIRGAMKREKLQQAQNNRQSEISAPQHASHDWQYGLHSR